MSLAGVLTASTVLLPLLVLCASPLCHGASTHNITEILAAFPDFTEFNRALTSSGVAAEIDGRNTLTVLAVDNAVMTQLHAAGLKPEDFQRAISLQVLLDYFDEAKLSSLQGGFAQAASLYQASGKAPGSAGIVNITTHQGGRVAFAASAPSGGLPDAFFQKGIKKMPYDIAVLQVSALISSPAAGAQAPAPAPGASPRFTDLLSVTGCPGFAGLVTASADAVATYDRSMARAPGLTVFCPSDEAVAAFNPTFKNLTADAQVSLLLYHGVAAHYSAQSLKAINRDVSTLATDRSKTYNLTIRTDGDTVKLSSASPSPASVTKTVLDKGNVAVYLIDAVLLPRDLFSSSQGPTAAPSPSPVSAPAQAPAAPAPVPVMAPATAPATPASAPVVAPATAPTPRRRPALPPVSAPAPSPDVDYKSPSDQKNNGTRGAAAAAWTVGAAVGAVVVILMVL